MISKQQQLECKEALLQRQSTLIEQVQKHTFGLDVEFAREDVGELSNYDNHPGDTGTELFEREKDISLQEHTEKELEDINKALHSLEEGSYGICTVCGEDIPYERLEAIPTTDRCIEHANEGGRERYRPTEEQSYSPNLNPDEEYEDEQNVYDKEDTWQDVSRYGTSETPSDLYGDHENYDDMYANSEELTEDISDFAAANIYGEFEKVMPNHEKYEADLDEEWN
ncbi:yteA family sporulation protein [Oceanobacillus kimchii]|uniref:yteA family sporulation protein n=1 Tax=Oceanobacillus kimchii TaxID=746691 RepID=UPI00034C06E3|nr:yteA family sporulation protein [Oceanobacillus kimchii]MCT1577370.1 yteA family sporulation protein [Oceanobacillus kimchii]MCT2136976.1 yteA family sporulation protein [Oceanobacillus kimchii]